VTPPPRYPFFLAIAAVAAASFALRVAFPIFALGDASFDDQLFVRQAEHLLGGRWLGPYDQLTLAKGAGFPMFMAAASLLGIPLKIAEHGAYLAASAAFAFVVGRVLSSRAAVLVVFGVLAFNPVFWMAAVGGRVMRENLYVSMGLGMIALAVLAFADESPRSLDDETRAKRWVLAGLGALSAWFWITREEGVWLAPSVGALVAWWLWRRRRPAGARALHHAAGLAVYLGIPVVVFALLVGAVNALNYWRYGLFINNDFRARDFPAAYGALARIEHERWRPYVVFPADARRKAYEASPAARELAPWFEGERGQFWRGVGCEQTHTRDCPEILSGWFMWALREAIHGVGNHTAKEARAFERRLAREVNAACDSGALTCGPRNASLVPPWRSEYSARVAEATARVTRTLLTLGKLPPDIHGSMGAEANLARFQQVTGGPLAPKGEQVAPPAAAKYLANWQGRALKVAFPAAFALWIALAVWSGMRRRWHAGHALVAALMLAVVARVLLLGFLEATSIPSDNMLYLAPVTPMALAFAPCVLFLALAMRRERRASNISP
jgi:hypothetical protein